IAQMPVTKANILGCLGLEIGGVMRWINLPRAVLYRQRILAKTRVVQRHVVERQLSEIVPLMVCRETNYLLQLVEAVDKVVRLVKTDGQIVGASLLKDQVTPRSELFDQTLINRSRLGVVI